jgi:hypothetical protein
VKLQWLAAASDRLRVNFYTAWTAGIVGCDSGAEFTNFELAQLPQKGAASSQYAIVQVESPPNAPEVTRACHDFCFS